MAHKQFTLGSNTSPITNSNNNKLSKMIVVLVMLLFTSFAKAVTINITANTSWSAISTGSGSGGQPNASDDIIVNGNNVTLTVNVATGVCKSITLGAGGNNNNGILTFNASSQITISGNLILAAISNKSNDVIMTSGGTLICQGLTVNTGTIGSFTSGTGSVQLTATNTLPSSPNFC